MNLGEFRRRTRDLADDMIVAVAEVDELAAMNVEALDIVNEAEIRNRKADGREAIELEGGKQKAIVIRF